jgi:hypothetical protein
LAVDADCFSGDKPDFKPISSCRDLESLSLHGILNEEAPWLLFQQLPRLRALDLSLAFFSENRWHLIAGCSYLEELQFPIVGRPGPGLQELRKLTKLTKLSLQACVPWLTDDDLTLLPNCHSLQEIDLSVTHISDAGLLHLKSLPNLHKLTLQFMLNVTKEGIAAFKKARPDITIEWSPLQTTAHPK